MHLVLDLDETLIHGTPTGSIKLRPYAYEFLNFCFQYFETVSIWTAATDGWWETNYYQFFTDYSFHEIFTRSNCELLENGMMYKPLSKLWDMYPEMNEHNTIIIDDNPDNAIYNVRNQITIPGFYGAENDFELYVLTYQLIEILNNFELTKTVYAININPQQPLTVF